MPTLKPLSIFCLTLSIPVLAFHSAAAGDKFNAQNFPAIDEVRFGVLAADLDPGGATDDSVAINAELLTPHIGGPSDASLWTSFFHPRLHIGTNVNTDDDGVNQAYAGLTWDYRFGERLFFETSFGGAVHDGETRDNDTNSYGCTAQFRESLSVGVQITERVSIMATVDHMSNAGLCDENQGLTNAGVRFGYRW